MPRPWQVIDKDSSDTTRSLSYLSVLSPLLYWNPQSCNWITTHFTWFLWVILIGVPTSTEQSTLLSHPTTFSKASPSILKVRWYPTCILELGYPSRRTINTGDSTLSYFRSLFNDHIRPTIIFRLSWPRRVTFTWWIIQSFKELHRTFPICFTKLRRIFLISKFFFHFFFRELYLNCCHSQIFYKVKKNFFNFQIFLSLFFRELYLNCCHSQIFYKVKKNFLIFQISTKLFFKELFGLTDLFYKVTTFFCFRQVPCELFLLYFVYILISVKLSSCNR